MSIGLGCTAVVGPDAQCGRALLRVLAGVAGAERGRVVLDGRPVSARQVRQAVSSPFRPSRRLGTASPALEPWAHLPPDDSAGARPWRRVLQAAWRRRCRLVLMNHPTEGHDPEQGAAFWADLALLLRSDAGPAAAVVTTTRLEEVERHCEAVIVLAGGRVAFQGSVEDLRALATDPAYRLRHEVPEGFIAVGDSGALAVHTDAAPPVQGDAEDRQATLLDGYAWAVAAERP